MYRVAIFFSVFLWSVELLSAEIIPANRRIDWATAGTTIRSDNWPIFANVKNVPYLAAGNGTTDDRAAIQNAINDSPAGQVVYLPAGTYRINGTLSIRKGIVLRGAGPNNTVIRYTGIPPSIVVSPGVDPEVPTYIASATAGYTKGSTSITINPAQMNSSLVPGKEIVIDQVNANPISAQTDPSNMVDALGSEGLCNYCSRLNGSRVLTQKVGVVAVNGSTISLDAPLYWSYNPALSPEVGWFSFSPVRNAGIEDICINYAEAVSDEHDTDRYALDFIHTSYCWIKNLRSESSISRSHLRLRSAYHCTVRDSYFTLSASNSSLSYGIESQLTTTGCLIENNAFYQITSPLTLGWGFCGSVIAYNYFNQIPYRDQGWMAGSLNIHCAQAMFLLFEGNIGTGAYFDFIHGSSSYQTLFRNRLYGFQNYVGFGASYNNNYSIVLEKKNWFANVVGNVLGTSGIQDRYQDLGSGSVSEHAIYKLGYAGTYSGPYDPNVLATLLRHGNWDTFNNSIVWDPSNPDHVLPSSMYLTSKPSWFGSLVWPPVDPASPGSITSSSIPAGYKFDHGINAPVKVVSRKPHGNAGFFDIDLPLSGPNGVECRSGPISGAHQIVVTFARPVTVSGASVVTGTGSVNSRTVSPDGLEITINLTGVANAQRLTIRLSAVSDGTGSGDILVPLGVLLGDSNGTGSVNGSDVSQIKGTSGIPVSAANFRRDLNASGMVSATDISLTRSKSGTALP
jgi:pectate lyase-like protein